MTRLVERGAPISHQDLQQQGWTPVRWDRHPDGDVRAMLGPFKPGHARTLTELLAGTLRQLDPDGRPMTACLVREAVARPVRGLPKGIAREMLTLRLDVDDAHAAADALGTVVRHLRAQLEPLAADSVDDVVRDGPVDQRRGSAPLPPAPPPRDLDHLDLRPRTRQSLRAAGLHAVDQLLTWTPTALLRLPLLGRRGLEEIQVALASRGLCLAADRP